MAKFLRALLASAFTALALISTAKSTNAKAVGDRVYLNGLLVVSLHYGRPEALVNHAQWLAYKLQKLNSQSSLALRVSDHETKIVSNDSDILTVTEEEAHEHGASHEALATDWLENIRKGLALPPVKFEKDGVRLRAGGASDVQILGSEAEQAEIHVSNPGIVDVHRDGLVLMLKANQLGRTTVTLEGPSGSDRLAVAVLPSAADLPQSVQVEVTGDPATAETVKGVVDGAVLTKVRYQPGAAVDYTLPAVTSISPEDSQTYTINVKVTAPDAFAAEGPVTIHVVNAPLAYKAEAELWYSNDPEDVQGARSLFAAKLRPHVPARLLYHHINASGYMLLFRARAINNGSDPARVLIIPGDSPPDRNPVRAGLWAGDQFLRNWVHFSGEIVTVPPHSELPISLRRMAPGQTVSGLCYLSIVDGTDSLTVTTDVCSAEAIDASFNPAFATSTPWRVIGCPDADVQTRVTWSEDVYPRPFTNQEVLYRVGGRFGFVRIGQKPIESYRREKLEGNFGVIYTIKARVENPTADPTDIEVVFESSAGYSGALFVVNGKVIRTPLLQPKEESQIAKIHLGPGDNQDMTILTCPLSGSSYPATLTIRPTGNRGF